MPEEALCSKAVPVPIETEEEDQLLRIKQGLPQNQRNEDIACSDLKNDEPKEEVEELPWTKVKGHFRDRQQLYFLLLSIAVLSFVLFCVDFKLKTIELQNPIEKHLITAFQTQPKIVNITSTNTSDAPNPHEPTPEIQRVITSDQLKQSTVQKTQNLIPPFHQSGAAVGKDVIFISKEGLTQEKEVIKQTPSPIADFKQKIGAARSKASILPDIAFIDKYVSHHKKDEKKEEQAPPKPTPPQVVAGITVAQKAQAIRWIDLKNLNDSNDFLANQEREYYERKYTISKFSQLPFCIVIPSYNNVKNNRHIKNIKSILQQEYTNYHIVFIDDASTDETGIQIEQYLKEQTQVPPERYKVIRNEKQMRAMHNLRRAALQFCQSDDIFIVIDGDDQLIGRQILKLYNSLFQMTKAWFIYTNFLSIIGNVGYSRPYPFKVVNQNRYRTYPFVSSHLRAFYTQLFRNIKDEDLRDSKGEYLKAANDVAICLPVMEQAGHRVIYMPQLTYFYNSNTGQNNHFLRLKEQKGNDRMLRGRKPYTVLKELHQDSSNLNITLANITRTILPAQPVKTND